MTRPDPPPSRLASGALGDAAFRRVFAADVVSFVGDGLITVALAFAVLRASGSTTALGLVLAVRAASLLAGLVAGGVLADRSRSRIRLMVAASGVRCVSQGALGVLLVTGAADPLLIAALQVPLGLATGVFNPSASGVMPAVVPAAHLQQANALRGIAQASGRIAGPLLAAVVIAVWSPGGAILLDAATFAVAAALLSRVRARDERRTDGTSFVRDLREGWGAVRSRTWLWLVLGYAGLGVMLGQAFTVLGPVVADRHLGGASGWGLVLGIGAAGGLLGGVVVLRLRPARPLVAAIVAVLPFALPAVALAALDLSDGWLVVVLVVAVTAAGEAGLVAFNALWETTLQEQIPGELLSRVTAYDWIASVSLQPVGAALVGPVAALAGVGTTLAACGAIELALGLAILGVPAIRAVRRVPPAAA